MIPYTVSGKTLSEEEIGYLLNNCSPNERKSYVQHRALSTWIEQNCRGTVEGATGIGKTRIGVMAVKQRLESNPNALIYIVVPTTTLRDTEWPEEFHKWDCGHLLTQVNLLCYKSLSKEKPSRDVDLLVLDEVHHLTLECSLFFAISNNWKVIDVLGLTAVLPSRSQEEDIEKRLRIDRLCPSCFKVTLEDAIKLELVADFEIKVMKFQLDAEDKYIPAGTKAVPFMTTEAANYKYLTKMVQKMAMAKKEGAKFSWIGKRSRFLKNLRSKTWLAFECMRHMINGTNRTLIFCGSIEQSEVLCGKWVYHSRTDDSHLDRFKNQEINFLGVVDALNEGKNIENLDQILIVQLNSNELNVIQRIGRTIRFRPGHKALVIVLIAEGTADENWYREAFANFDKSRIKEYKVKIKKPEDEPAGSNQVSVQ